MGDSSGSKKQLGKIMLQQKLVTQDELTGILEDQHRRGGKLASAATRDGKVSVPGALRALSEQTGVPAIDLRCQIVSLTNLQLIPLEIAREHVVLPIKMQGEQLLLAMADPLNKSSIEEIGFVTAKTVFPYIALDEVLRTAIETAYALAARGEKFLVGEAVTDAELEAQGITRPGPVVIGPQKPEHKPIAPPFPAPPPPPPPPDLLKATDPQVAGVVHGRPPTDHGPELDQAFSVPPPRISSSRPPSDGPRLKRILIVEDDAAVRQLIRLTLQQKPGIECFEADSGNAALELIRAEPPDAIVLDVVLPGVHGFDICRRLHGSQRYGHIPIVIVSAIHRGWRVAEDLRVAYGVQHVFDKPIDLARFARTIELLLQGKPVSPDPITLSEEAEVELSHGMAAFERGDMDAAIAHLATGVRIDPLAFELQYHLGLLYGRREDLFSAIEALESAVRLHPRHFSALKNLAVVYQRAGFRHKAVETWDRAMANAPDDATRNSVKEHMVTLL
jgi:DNA-binding response OmpR family regulator